MKTLYAVIAIALISFFAQTVEAGCRRYCAPIKRVQKVKVQNRKIIVEQFITPSRVIEFAEVKGFKAIQHYPTTRYRDEERITIDVEPIILYNYGTIISIQRH